MIVYRVERLFHDLDGRWSVSEKAFLKKEKAEKYVEEMMRDVKRRHALSDECIDCCFSNVETKVLQETVVECTRADFEDCEGWSRCNNFTEEPEDYLLKICEMEVEE